MRNDEIVRLLNETLPSYQATSKSKQNLGFGHIFYGVARTMRPSAVAVIGSKAGFAPLCFAIGMRDNGGSGLMASECYDVLLEGPARGSLDFIDPSYSMERGDDGHWFGLGKWDYAHETEQLWDSFGVGDIVTHFKLRSDEFLALEGKETQYDIVYIDGDHSYEGVTHDILQFGTRLSKNGIMMAHDCDPLLRDEFPEVGGFEAIESAKELGWEVFRLPVYPGLAFIRPT